MINLLFLVNKIGRSWSTIEKDYKRFFQNRNVKSLKLKYFSIQKNKEKFRHLFAQANILEDIGLLDNKRNKYFTLNWSHKEVVFFLNALKFY